MTHNHENRGSTVRVRIFSVMIVLVAVCGFIWLAWYAYQSGTMAHDPEEVPYVKADPEPFRVKPDDPGGMEIPHRDKMVYDALAGKDSPPKVEKLLPDEEEPIIPEENLAMDSAEQAEAALVKSRQKIIASTTPKVVEPLLEEKKKGVAPKMAEKKEEARDEVTIKKTSVTKDAQKVETVEKANKADDEKKAAVNKASPVEKETPEEKEAVRVSPWRVQLMAGKSREDAVASWEKIRKKHGRLLEGLGYVVERADLGDKGIFYRLQVVPFTSRESADALCKKLASQKQGCFVVKRQ